MHESVAEQSPRNISSQRGTPVPPLDPRGRAVAPPAFRPHAFERSFVLPHPRPAVWSWLNDPSTFTKQVWPWRVEFVEGSGLGDASGFAPGVRNVHHGPLMVFAGEIGEVREPAYRDLVYDYGSHAVSLRLIRPTRLQFWLEELESGPAGGGAAEAAGQTRLRLRVDSVVKPWVAGVWTTAQAGFWWFFPRWANREIARRRRRSGKA